jgi:hypothetical protein
MSSEDLGRLLAQLHARLKHAKSLDAESRKLLLTVAADIEKALASDERQIMDTLGKAGI